ncbi:Hypothetical protein D9617_8g049750 [Elsinoe fawcettii]|nr:Hypothetical protein D9617_8g049750 [Elsinoe fawcettii]
MPQASGYVPFAPQRPSIHASQHEKKVPRRMAIEPIKRRAATAKQAQLLPKTPGKTASIIKEEGDEEPTTPIPSTPTPAPISTRISSQALSSIRQAQQPGEPNATTDKKESRNLHIPGAWVFSDDEGIEVSPTTTHADRNNTQYIQTHIPRFNSDESMQTTHAGASAKNKDEKQIAAAALIFANAVINICFRGLSGLTTIWHRGHGMPTPVVVCWQFLLLDAVAGLFYAAEYCFLKTAEVLVKCGHAVPLFHGLTILVVGAIFVRYWLAKAYSGEKEVMGWRRHAVELEEP